MYLPPEWVVLFNITIFTTDSDKVLRVVANTTHLYTEFFAPKILGVKKPVLTYVTYFTRVNKPIIIVCISDEFYSYKVTY